MAVEERGIEAGRGSARRGDGVGSYFPPLQRTDLPLQVSVDCSSARRNSRSAAGVFRASGVSRGIRPSGGSTISDVRAPMCWLDRKNDMIVRAGDVEFGPMRRRPFLAAERRPLLVQLVPLRGGEEFLVRVSGRTLKRRIEFIGPASLQIGLAIFARQCVVNPSGTGLTPSTPSPQPLRWSRGRRRRRGSPRHWPRSARSRPS
jgi:hypothetical protein